MSFFGTGFCRVCMNGNRALLHMDFADEIMDLSGRQASNQIDIKSLTPSVSEFKISLFR